MDQIFQDASNAVVEYFRSADYGAAIFWLYIAVPLFGIWLAAKVILVLRPGIVANEGQKPVLRRVFAIHRAFILSACVVSAVLIALFIYYWTQGFYNTYPLEASHLISLSLCLSVSTIAYLQMRGLVSRRKIRDFVKSPVNRDEEQSFAFFARQAFVKTKAFTLLPVLGFLVLSLLQTKSYNLVSFVLDTSSSMGMSNDFFGEAPIETGQVALRRTVQELDPWTNVIISVFEEEHPGKSYKPDIHSIVSASDFGALNGKNEFFPGTQKASALAYISTLEDDLTGSTPLCETIWSNFLFTRALVSDGQFPNYENIVAIYITDGGDRLGDAVDGFLCENADFAEFYNVGANINIINLSGGYVSAFIAKSETCGYRIWEGYNAQLFNEALNDILANFKSDWNFVIWLGIVYLVFLAVNLLIVPKSEV